MNRPLSLVFACTLAAASTFAPWTAQADEQKVAATVPADGGASDADAASTSISTGKLAVGIALLGVGSLAVLGGGVAYTAYSAQTSDSCAGASAGCSDPYKGAKSASIVALVLGGAGIAAGVPLILTSKSADHGARKRKARRAASLVPEVQLGLGAASLSWKF